MGNPKPGYLKWEYFFEDLWNRNSQYGLEHKNRMIKLFEALATDGYDVKVTEHGVNATLNGISVRYILGRGSCYVYKLQPTGGYFKSFSIYPSTSSGDYDYDAFKQRIKDFVKPEIKHNASIKPQPMVFQPVSYKYFSNTKVYERYATIFRISKISMVGINDDGSIDEDAVAIPGKEVWYHMECANQLSATFDIITNGEVFYPIRRYGVKKLTSSKNPKASVDLNKMNIDDKAFINTAIAQFTSEIVK